MTREEIERDYDVEAYTGIIRGMGKFEGEMLYVPFFYDRFLEGFSDRERNICDDESIIGFDICDGDRDLFPELGNKRTVNLHLRSDGFVIEVNRFR